MSTKRLLYVQYTNPAGYPPLEHSSRIMAERGWDVVFLGIRMRVTDVFEFPPHDRIRVLLMPAEEPGWRQKLHYVRFCIWVLFWCWRWRPDCVYASDLFSCFPGWLIKRLLGRSVIYHEHDAPADAPRSPFLRWMMRMRCALARSAELVVVPNRARGRVFARACGVPDGKVLTVWNCPRLEEIPAQAGKPDGPLVLYYHGNLSPALLPTTVIEAIAALEGAARLLAVGYETIGTVGYRARLTDLAAQLGAALWVRIEPACSRQDLWALLQEAHVGLALMPRASSDVNMTEMVGASNKAFDYLAASLALLVTDLPEWHRVFVEPGFGLACDPDDTQTLVAALRWLIEHPEKLNQMGLSGRQRIIDDWHYEAQMAPVVAHLEQLAERS